MTSNMWWKGESSEEKMDSDREGRGEEKKVQEEGKETVVNANRKNAWRDEKKQWCKLHKSGHAGKKIH